MGRRANVHVIHFDGGGGGGGGGGGPLGQSKPNFVFIDLLIGVCDPIPFLSLGANVPLLIIRGAEVLIYHFS